MRRNDKGDAVRGLAFTGFFMFFVTIVASVSDWHLGGQSVIPLIAKILMAVAFAAAFISTVAEHRRRIASQTHGRPSRHSSGGN